MLYKYQYATSGERASLIENNADKYLVEQQEITEGNFLIFSDIKPVEIIHEATKMVENADLIALQQAQLDIMQGMADIWTKLNGGV